MVAGLVLRGLGFVAQLMFTGLAVLGIVFVLGFIGGVMVALLLAGWQAAWSLMR